MTGPEVITGEVCVAVVAVAGLGTYCVCRASTAAREAAEKAVAAWLEAVKGNWITIDVKAAVTKPDGRYSAKLLATETPSEHATAAEGGEETAPAHLQDGYAGHPSGSGQ
jgi:hypothetical protein